MATSGIDEIFSRYGTRGTHLDQDGSRPSSAQRKLDLAWRSLAAKYASTGTWPGSMSGSQPSIRPSRAQHPPRTAWLRGREQRAAEHRESAQFSSARASTEYIAFRRTTLLASPSETLAGDEDVTGQAHPLYGMYGSLPPAALITVTELLDPRHSLLRNIPPHPRFPPLTPFHHPHARHKEAHSLAT